MATFVLVHGAWHGGWCWHKLTPLLHDAGHRVYTPTQTGVGDRSHLLSRDVDLNLHVTDTLQLLEFEDLRDVILVGHSYGGMVISGVAEKAAERLKRLIFLDGFVPTDGQSAFDVVPEGEPLVRASAQDTGWLVAPFPAEAFGISDPDDLAFVQPRLRPSPLVTWEQPVRLQNAQAARLPRTYVRALQFAYFNNVAERCRQGNYDYFEMDTGHDLMITQPGELAQFLLRYA